MSPQLIQLIVFVVVGIAAVIFLWRTHSAQQLDQLLKSAQAAVMAAEQAKATGQISTNDQQLRFAIDTLKVIFPQADAFSDEQILSVIHSFVPLANAATAQIEAAWKDQPSLPKPLTVGLTGLQ